MARQLNIRSDEAYDRARRLAVRLGTSTTEAVVQALRRYEADVTPLPTYGDLTPEQRHLADELLALAKKAREAAGPLATSQHDELYDEFGLPK